ncbi:tRNA lysidine(34) synthetase TilS [Thermoactinomyces mirandus]|uniref:tRNA(Ile)-lysidine synthase n=1 Tax=Thermoactinomyces mirandus TaxID=2756294 RepID=A0A7W2APS7_9BACL|nr:tRNA lysidine(34) synthetase TilS [Thermoactinomyces mirandus]MBA4601264.1 tRNA lysidine(34) synthetase TilS [Thermoactinomyces mirandus]
MFLERLQKEIESRGLIKQNDHILVGVSGGPDSMALLYSLKQLEQVLGFRAFAVHVNHHLRDEESDEDEKYVTLCAQNWGISIDVVHVDVPGELKRQGGNKQALARRLRYQAFKQVADKRKVNRLALAHHADDQMETVMMRLIRGTGIKGLAGMEWVRRWENYVLIRPFLEFTKEEIIAFCKENSIMYREDSSNRSSVYTRNRIRQELIPLLKTFNPRVEEAILKLSELIREEEKEWEHLVNQAFNQVVAGKTENSYVLDLSSFLHLSVALQRRVVKLILSYLCHQEVTELSLDKVDQVRNLAKNQNPSAMIHLFKEIVAERVYGKLIIKKMSLTPDDAELKHEMQKFIWLPRFGTASLPGFLGTMEIIESDQPIHRLRNACDKAVFDLDLLKDPLYVRVRQPGDKMRCSGMSGRKKVKSLMMEAKIPRKLRARYPIVGSGDELIWIPGVKRSDRAPVTSKTSRFLYLLWDLEVPSEIIDGINCGG